MDTMENGLMFILNYTNAYAPINVKPQRRGAYIGDLTFCANFRSKAPLWGWKSESNVIKFPTVGLEI
jgi:hypothetical protein